MGFFIPLLLGVFLAFGVLAHFIEKLLDNYPKPMAGLFWTGRSFNTYRVRMVAAWAHADSCIWFLSLLQRFNFGFEFRSDTESVAV